MSALLWSALFGLIPAITVVQSASATTAVAIDEPSWVSVRAGIGFAQRTLTATDRAGRTRLRYEGGAFASPHVQLRVRPFANAALRGLRPLELAVSARFSLPFSSRLSGDAEPRATRFSEVLVRAGYLASIPGTRWSVGPRVGYHFLGFAIERPRFGDPGSEPPTVAYHSVMAGLGVEAPVGLEDGAINATVDVAAAFLLSLDGGQVFSDTYFPEGNAKAVRIDAGVHLEISSELFFWVEGQFLAYALSLGSGEIDRGSDRSTALLTGLRVDF